MPNDLAWFYSRNGRQLGPVSFTELRALAKRGELLPTDWAWHEGLDQWAFADSIPGLFLGVNTPHVETEELVCCPNCFAKYAVGKTQEKSARLECQVCENLFSVRQRQQSATSACVGHESDHLPPEGLDNTCPLVAADISRIRVALTDYADAIPYHGVDEFGDHVTSINGFIVPVFSITLKTLYEKRTAVPHEEPYSDRSLPARMAMNADGDLWNFPFPEQVTFTNSNHEHRLEHTQKTVKCASCAATGDVRCSQCDGACQLACPKCGGRKTITCTACSGKSLIRESRVVQRQVACTGSIFSGGCNRGRLIKPGKIGTLDQFNSWERRDRITNEPCPRCQGSGVVTKFDTEAYTVPCSTCRQSGQVYCDGCGASGLVRCPMCQSRGKVVCGRCKGNKLVVTFSLVSQSFIPSEATIIASCSELPANVLESLTTEEFRPVLKWQGSALPADPEADGALQTKIPWIAANIRQLCAKAKESVSPDVRIARQEIVIRQAQVLYSLYLYDGNEYALCFVGRDCRPFPITSPFASFTRAMLERAAEAGQNGDYAAGGVYLRRCWDVAKRDRCSKTVVDSSAVDGKVVKAARENARYVAKRAAALRP